MEYRLTQLGESLFPVVQAAHLWGIDYVRSLPEDEAPITSKARKCYQKGLGCVTAAPRGAASSGRSARGPRGRASGSVKS